MTHDAESCGLCLRLRAGFAQTRNGHDISPVHEECNLHHWPDYPCPAKTHLDPSICNRCGVNKRELEDIPDSARWEQKRYARYCRGCLLKAGYVKVAHKISTQHGLVEVSWWEKRRTEPDTMSTDEIFARLGAKDHVKAQR